MFVFIRHHMTRFGKTAGATLILLASFQFAEYRICTGTGGTSLLWARIGFIAITLLPIAGLYLVSLVSRKQHFLKIGHTTAVGFMAAMGVLYLMIPATRSAIASIMCGFAIILAFILTFKVVPAYDRVPR